MVQQTNIRTLNLPRLNFSHEIIHSVFDSDVCCFNEVITIPEILEQVRYIRKVTFWSNCMNGKIGKSNFFCGEGSERFWNANLYCILWVMMLHCVCVLNQGLGISLPGLFFPLIAETYTIHLLKYHRTVDDAFYLENGRARGSCSQIVIRAFKKNGHSNEKLR